MSPASDLMARRNKRNERLYNARVAARDTLQDLAAQLNALLAGRGFDASERAQLENCAHKLASVIRMLPTDESA